MQKAYQAVTESSVTITAASKEFNVPRTTLTDRVKGRVTLSTKLGRPPVLNENALVRYITYMAEHRYPVTRTQVIGWAWAWRDARV